VLVDGEEATTYGVASSLADSVSAGDWDGLLLMQFEDEETAETVRTEICKKLSHRHPRACFRKLPQPE